MLSPKKINCFSRPSRDPRGQVLDGVSLCRQGHSIWLGEHFDLDSFKNYMNTKRKETIPTKLVGLASRQSPRIKRKASRKDIENSFHGSVPISPECPRVLSPIQTPVDKDSFSLVLSSDESEPASSSAYIDCDFEIGTKGLDEELPVDADLTDSEAADLNENDDLLQEEENSDYYVSLDEAVNLNLQEAQDDMDCSLDENISFDEDVNTNEIMSTFGFSNVMTETGEDEGIENHDYGAAVLAQGLKVWYGEDFVEEADSDEENACENTVGDIPIKLVDYTISSEDEDNDLPSDNLPSELVYSVELPMDMEESELLYNIDVQTMQVPEDQSHGDQSPEKNRDLETPPSSAPSSPPTAPSSPTLKGPRTPHTFPRSSLMVQENSPFRRPYQPQPQSDQPVLAGMKGALTHR